MHSLGKCFAFQKIIWCNSGNIWCIINERFCVFKKTFGIFFQERFLAFFRERFCELQKRFCVFQQIFSVIWEKHFAPFGHRNHHSNQSLTRNKRNNHHSIKRNYFAQLKNNFNVWIALIRGSAKGIFVMPQLNVKFISWVIQLLVEQSHHDYILRNYFFLW